MTSIALCSVLLSPGQVPACFQYMFRWCCYHVMSDENMVLCIRSSSDPSYCFERKKGIVRNLTTVLSLELKKKILRNKLYGWVPFPPLSTILSWILPTLTHTTNPALNCCLIDKRKELRCPLISPPLASLFPFQPCHLPPITNIWPRSLRLTGRVNSRILKQSFVAAVNWICHSLFLFFGKLLCHCCFGGGFLIANNFQQWEIYNYISKNKIRTSLKWGIFFKISSLHILLSKDQNMS